MTWLHRLYAKLRGHFWSQCPICLQFFGQSQAGLLPQSDLLGTVVCRRCAPIVRGARLVQQITSIENKANSRAFGLCDVDVPADSFVGQRFQEMAAAGAAMGVPKRHRH